MKATQVKTMNDFIRESLSYPELYKKMFQVKRCLKPEKIRFGTYKEQHFLYYEPKKIKSKKIIIWVHGGGWDSGTPRFFDFVGQCIVGAGYRFVSLDYRKAPIHKYPCQIKDVCLGYNKAVEFMNRRGIDTSQIIVSGSSAGAHLTSILCFNKKIQKKFHVDISNVAGFIGIGGPYSFSGKKSWTVTVLLNRLFKNGYDRRLGEPCSMINQSQIPMLLIQSKHDGLLEYSGAERFYEKAVRLGNECELYSVVDKKNTHSWYTAGMFLETREENRTLEKFFSWIETI